LAERERWCGVCRRRRVVVVFSGEGELLWFLDVRDRWCGVKWRGSGGVVFSGEGEVL